MSIDYMGVMSKEEEKKWLEKIEGYKCSPFVLDRIIGILMDTRTGGSGLWEDVAMAKAHAILHCVNTGEIL